MSNHNQHNSSMTWMMLLCCLLPVLFILFAGKRTGLSNWILVAAILIFVVVHFWSRRKTQSAGTKIDEAHRGEDNNPPFTG